MKINWQAKTTAELFGADMFYHRAPLDRKIIDEMLALGATASLELAADAAGRQRRLGAAGIGMRRAGHAYIIFAIDGNDVKQVPVKLTSPRVETAAREFIIEFNKRVREHA
jgi:hypothetical protein